MGSGVILRSERPSEGGDANVKTPQRRRHTDNPPPRHQPSPAEAVMFVSQRLVKIICQIPVLFVCVRVFFFSFFSNHYLKS